MMINLTPLKKHGKITLNEHISFNEELYLDTDILNLLDFHFVGSITYNYEGEINLAGILKGDMLLADSRSLAEIKHPIELNIDEIIPDQQNTLDISLILWQNIVLEIPIRITNQNAPNKVSGVGWSLAEAKPKDIDPRLAPLRALLEEKE